MHGRNLLRHLWKVRPPDTVAMANNELAVVHAGGRTTGNLAPAIVPGGIFSSAKIELVLPRFPVLVAQAIRHPICPPLKYTEA
jgi:hypothetical protein